MRQISFVFILLLFSSSLFAHTHGAHEAMPHHENPASQFLMNESAGTAVNPGSSPMHMNVVRRNDWAFITHGYVFLNGITQTGPRGEDRIFSTNHLMLIAERPLTSKSSLLIRGMFSLEPATITRQQYPLLFQTGETAHGRPIVDGQHPHDLFMEISLQFALQLNDRTLVHFYAAPVGDPALGPVAYPHRISAQEIPQATLAHHLQDSSHIVYDVFTAGIKYGMIRWEFSGFHGAEPDQNRWDLSAGAIDSWSTRFTFAPNENWVAQLSTGHLSKPEELEPGDIQRTTASVTYNYMSPHGFWANTFLYGRNHKLLEERSTNGFGFETLYQFHHINYITGRVEFVDKDELFADNPALQKQFDSLGETSFRINAFTFGYARDLNLAPYLGFGIGGNVTLYSFPKDLDEFYGSSPKTFLLYLRIRPGH